MIGSNHYTPAHCLLTAVDSTKWQRYWQIAHHEGINYLQYIFAIMTKILEAKANRVIIIHQDRAIFFAAFLAALYSKVIVVIPNTPAPKHIDEIMQPSDLLLNEQILDNQSLTNTVSKKMIQIADLDPWQAKVIFYTSGSTGRPQAVTKTLANLEAEIMVLEELWGCKGVGGTYFSTVPHSHLYGFLFSLLWPVCTGKKINRKTCATWEEIISVCMVDDYIISSPAHLGRFPVLQQPMQLQPKMVFSSGGLLSYRAAMSSEHFFGVIPIEVYGSTETGGIAYRRQQVDNQLWTKFRGIKISATKNNLLVVKSTYITGDSAYITQDLVIIVTSDQFKLLGRADRVEKIEGKRISLPEIEIKLKSLEYITDAVVFPLPRLNRDQLGAAIVLSTLGQTQLKVIGKLNLVREIKANLLQFFELVVLPQKWSIVTEIPLNAQGKCTHDILQNIGTIC
jgi:acyl-coenzyme A synthetase/AMP-(fatty) acid ligase